MLRYAWDAALFNAAVRFARGVARIRFGEVEVVNQTERQTQARAITSRVEIFRINKNKFFMNLQSQKILQLFLDSAQVLVEWHARAYDFKIQKKQSIENIYKPQAPKSLELGEIVQSKFKSDLFRKKKIVIESQNPQNQFQMATNIYYGSLKSTLMRNLDLQKSIYYKMAGKEAFKQIKGTADNLALAKLIAPAARNTSAAKSTHAQLSLSTDQPLVRNKSSSQVLHKPKGGQTASSHQHSTSTANPDTILSRYQIKDAFQYQKDVKHARFPSSNSEQLQSILSSQHTQSVTNVTSPQMKSRGQSLHQSQNSLGTDTNANNSRIRPNASNKEEDEGAQHAETKDAGELGPVLASPEQKLISIYNSVISYHRLHKKKKKMVTESQNRMNEEVVKRSMIQFQQSKHQSPPPLNTNLMLEQMQEAQKLQLKKKRLYTQLSLHKLFEPSPNIASETSKQPEISLNTQSVTQLPKFINQFQSSKLKASLQKHKAAQLHSHLPFIRPQKSQSINAGARGSNN